MKLIVTWKANGQAFSQTVKGTRGECDEGLARIMRIHSSVLSFTSREVGGVDVAEALGRNAQTRGFPNGHRDGLD